MAPRKRQKKVDEKENSLSPEVEIGWSAHFIVARKSAGVRSLAGVLNDIREQAAEVDDVEAYVEGKECSRNLDMLEKEELIRASKAFLKELIVIDKLAGKADKAQEEIKEAKQDILELVEYVNFVCGYKRIIADVAVELAVNGTERKQEVKKEIDEMSLDDTVTMIIELRGRVCLMGEKLKIA